ncbi:MAG: hypothetical protein LBT47_12295 [Deltaproteobacteria bacterium]|nr:hypothetical protein [Deltaproteobacteria bacterium]
MAGERLPRPGNVMGEESTIFELLRLNGWIEHLDGWRKAAVRKLRSLRISSKYDDQDINSALNQAFEDDKLLESLKKNDAGLFRYIWKTKAHSILSDKFRNHQYRAIRDNVKKLHDQGYLFYLPGKRMSSNPYSYFAAGQKADLPKFIGQYLSETPRFDELEAPKIDGIDKSTEFVRIAAKSLWSQYATIIPPPAYLSLKEFQVFINHKFNISVITKYLPANVRSVELKLNQSEQCSYFGSHELDETEISNRFAQIETLIDSLFSLFSQKSLIIFCLVTSNLTLEEIAKYVDLNSPASVSYHYNKALKIVKDFCSRQPMLADTDCDPKMREVFTQALCKQCEAVASEIKQGR